MNSVGKPDALITDGFSFSANFTRPCFEEQDEIRPQDVENHPDDVTWYVDPGRSKTFTAMKGISTNNVPAPIIQHSTKEYYHISLVNQFREKRHQLKMLNYNLLGYISNLIIGKIQSSH
jgi:hypothetical protein